MSASAPASRQTRSARRVVACHAGIHWPAGISGYIDPNLALSLAQRSSRPTKNSKTAGVVTLVV
jgi:hypothetical protein